MMKSTISEKTTSVIRSVFARKGLFKQLVSDNWTPFVSSTFAHFMKSNGITHLQSAPYHATANGQAERFVQTFKQSMLAMKNEPGYLNEKIANFMLSYRNTVHATTHETPVKLFLNRNLRTRLDLLKSSTRFTNETGFLFRKGQEKGISDRSVSNG